jgi:hypothetical protein
MTNEFPLIDQIGQIETDLAAAEARVRELKAPLKNIKMATRIATPGKPRKVRNPREDGEGEVKS